MSALVSKEGRIRRQDSLEEVPLMGVTGRVGERGRVQEWGQPGGPWAGER